MLVATSTPAPLFRNTAEQLAMLSRRDVAPRIVDGVVHKTAHKIPAAFPRAPWPTPGLTLSTTDQGSRAALRPRRRKSSARKLLPSAVAPTHSRLEYDTFWGQILLEELKLARLSAGWSQRALADRIGVDAQTIKRLEKGVGSVPTLVSAMTALDFRLTGLGPGRALPEQLRARRRKQSMSLDEMASRARLSRATVASLERGGGSVVSLLRLLAVIAPRARRRAPERSYWGQGDKHDRDIRFTPPDFMTNIYAAFGEVDLDPCGHLLSPVIAHRRILLSEGGDGLADHWSGRLVFVNPPFSELLKWLRRAHDEWRAGRAETVVCLVPVRTDSAWFHDTLSADADIYLLKGRVRFLDPRGKGQHTPFSLMVLTLGATVEQKARYAELVPGFWLARSITADDKVKA